MMLNVIELGETVRAFAECDMKIYKTADMLHIRSTSLYYRLKLIEKATGLKPQKFYDLIKLLGIYKEEEYDECL